MQAEGFSLIHHDALWTISTASDDVGIAKFALEYRSRAGMDINSTTGHLGETLLLYAIRLGAHKVCMHLLQAGADASIGDCKGWTPLMAAAEESPRMLLLMFALWESMHRESLHMQSDAYGTFEEGITALHMASVKGNSVLLQLLLANDKVSVSSCTVGLGGLGKGDYALHLAARHGHILCVEILCAHKREKVDVMARNLAGDTALHEPSPRVGGPTRSRAIRLVKLLVENGCDISAQGANMDTVLHRSGFWWREMVQLLIDMGCDTDLLDRNGKTSSQRAYSEGFPSIAAFIEEAESKRARKIAFAMGMDRRLGIDSGVMVMIPEVLRMVVDML
jgi:ankyrin repeat protein